MVMLLTICSGAIFAQQTKSPVKGNRVYENQVKMTDVDALIKVYPTLNGYVLSFPDQKNYLFVGGNISMINDSQFQKIKSSPTNKKSRIEYIWPNLTEATDSEVSILPVPRNDAISLSADLPDGSYQVNIQIAKIIAGLKDAVKTELRMRFVKEKKIITVIMEEAPIQ